MTVDRATTKELRAWAGDKVSPSGSLPWALIVAWNKKHPDRPYEHTPIRNPSRERLAKAGNAGRASRWGTPAPP